MRVHNCIQGTTEWLQARSGIPTASEFDNIVTPTGKISKSQDPYTYALIAERIMGRPRVEAVSSWMKRGSIMETEAAAFYEFQRDCDPEPVGFITNDEGTIGASPDRLVGDDGLLEIKCPSEHVHVAYLLSKALDRTYYPQIMGQLWITGRTWVDILSYHPAMPPAIVRAERDEEFIKLLADEVTKFSERLEKLALELKERGLIRPVEKAKDGKAEYCDVDDLGGAA